MSANWIHGLSSRLKKAILDVETPPGTKILNIEVTLPDPVLARKLASYIAQETVRLSLDANLGSDERLTARLEKLRDAARERVRSAERAALDAAGRKASPGLATRPEAAELERKAAWEALESAELQLGEARALAGESGERLRVIDPGGRTGDSQFTELTAQRFRGVLLGAPPLR